MTRDQAEDLAVAYAKASPHSYTQVENFVPHDWVVDAILEAHFLTLDSMVTIDDTSFSNS
jgi:hypothetical protein